MATNLVVCLFLSALRIEPGNINLDHYDVIPPLGLVSSIAASQLELYVLSDDYLMILERPSLRLKRTLAFDPAPYLVAYDMGGDLWLATADGLARFNPILGTVREYPFDEAIAALACGPDQVYLQAGRKFSLNKVTGKYVETASFPEGLKWSRPLAADGARKYPYLIPYYYLDELTASQSAETRFPITALCEDGLDLFVGTRGYGLLQYNTASGQKRRVIYGPLGLDLRQAREMGGRFYFLSDQGISQYDPDRGEWEYRRMNVPLSGLLPLDSSWVVTSGSTISYLYGSMVFPIDHFSSTILAVAQTGGYFYVGTSTGMFRIERGTTEAFAFGPEKQAVLAILPVGGLTYVGTDRSLYRYRADAERWDLIFPRGVKKIVSLDPEVFVLSVDNQLIRFRPDLGDAAISDSSWVLLPYFNIYDIEAADSVLYCAAYNGLNRYEPATGLLKPIYGLPRQKYNSVLVAAPYVYAAADRLLYRLPLTSRD